VFTNYNVMGGKGGARSLGQVSRATWGRNIRVNAISAGAIKTLAASGISGFSSTSGLRDKPRFAAAWSCEVADAALFLLSPARGVTTPSAHGLMPASTSPAASQPVAACDIASPRSWRAAAVDSATATGFSRPLLVPHVGGVERARHVWAGGVALVAGATGAALLWTGVFGAKPDWIDPSP
jgi:hypothetical protein